MFSRLILRCRYQQNAKPSSIWRHVNIGYRHTSSATHRDEDVAIPVGGNGAVHLQISRPVHAATHNNILVYLPSGPLADKYSLTSSSVLDVASFKKALPTTTIVNLQYRLNPADASTTGTDRDALDADNRFPTPIHDVFAAWDFITDSLRLYNHEVMDGKKIYYKPCICLYGSHIGGALAMSLALTNPSLIRAVALHNALVDWTGFDELAAIDIGGGKEVEGERKRKRDTRKQTEKERIRNAARALMVLRGQLFRTHSGYFDAFASPTLFLRAPGRDTPIEGLVSGEKFEEMVMRYGEEEDEVGVIKVDGQGYGPYDDDWHAHGSEERDGVMRKAESSSEDSATNNNKDNIGEGINLDTGLDSKESLRADSSTSTNPTAEDHTSIKSSTQSLEGSVSFSSTADSTPRRRKVLRRWPPAAQPEDVILPYVNIFLTDTSTSFSESVDVVTQKTLADISPVLRLQGLEMQDLLRRACFWGREKSLSEKRVALTDLDGCGHGEGQGTASEETNSKSPSKKEEVIKWLSARFNDT